MTFKKVGIFLFLIFSIIPFYSIFAQSQNVGIIPANIWYSQDPFQEGDKIKIYTVVYNSDTRKLFGTVIFFDNNVYLGSKDFSVDGKSTTDVWIDWAATSGDHVIYAKIENAKFLISEGKYEETYLAENKTEESKRTVSKKILDELPNTIANKISESTTAVSNVGNIIKDNTPVAITNAVNSTTNSLENLRTNISTSLENKQSSIKKEIEALNTNTTNSTSAQKTIKEKTTDKKQVDTKNTVASTTNNSGVLKPLKYVELFFITIFSFIFKYKIVFYGLLAIILFLIIRYIWRLIF